MDISVVYYLLTETKFLVFPTLKKQWRVFLNSHSNTDWLNNLKSNLVTYDTTVLLKLVADK